jgi:serine protease Do
MTFGDSAKTRVGDVVLAIGNPFGVGETVTMGIVSATGRRSLGISGPGGYEDFIQTDAAINPGNSGGALVNAKGELIGINTAILSGSGGNQGIGFAIPVSMARGIMEQILKTGKVTRGYMGVIIQEITPELAKAFKLQSAHGALIGDVTPNSPAAKAGIQKGDIVTSLNGEPVTDYSSFRLKIAQTPPSTSVKLDLMRNGQKQQATVTLEEFPDEQARAATPQPEQGEGTLEGVQVSALTPQITQQLNLPVGTRGVVVTRVNPGTPAAEAGLQRGDVIQEVNRNAITSVDEFRAAVSGSGSEPILLLVNRGGTTQYAVVTPR